MSLPSSLRTVLPPVAFGVALVVLWQLVVSIGNVPPFLLPAPSAIGAQVGDNIDTIVSSATATGRNALVGMVIGVVLGLLTAILAAWSRIVDDLVSPLAAGAAAIPIVALAPAFQTMFSATSDTPRRLVVAIVVFFPVFISTVRGLRQVLPVHQDLMTAYAASGWVTTRVVRLPGAVPFIFTGIRVAAPNAVIAAIVAEYFGGLQNGLGSRITSAASNTAYARAWAYVAAAIVLGLLFYLIALGLERVATAGRAPGRT